MNWEDLRHFAAFAVEGSLSGAARRLSVEHATIARRIAGLEQELGLKLVDRRGRRLILTADGIRVAQTAQRMEHEGEAIARLAQAMRTNLTGEVTLSAPSAFAATRLAQPLAELSFRHPGLHVRLLGEARLAALEKREADIAIRLSRPQGEGLIAAKLGQMQFHLYAAPHYLDKVTEADWCFIGSVGAVAHAPQQIWLESNLRGRQIGLASDHTEIQRALAIQGGGVAILPEFEGEAAGSALRRARPHDAAPVSRDIWLVYHSDMKAAAPLQAVLEVLRNSMRTGNG